ncbi:MAG: type IV pilin N-terminal domain-containing protein [Methanomicrobiales archaeon]|nr:type IV pilin N-terminal domain-containing protein [Methanomicrobiales archaeon]
MKFLKREDAVSPVIGVILMVAITVILAAVIAAFVFGMASGVSKTKAVAATARQMGGDVFIVTYQGGQDDPIVAGLQVQFQDNGTVYCYDSAGTGALVTPCPVPLVAANKPAVGSSMTTSAGASASGQDHIVVTGVFTDGSSQVILDTYV